jgi:ribonuclease P protein component
VLERRHRLTSAAGFATALRRGRRAASRTLVVHVHQPGPLDPTSTGEQPGAPVTGTGAAVPQAGFIVSKAVGNAVARNRVKRRLRHLVRERLDRVPAAGLVVVRALPSASTARSSELGHDLDRCLDRVLGGVRP